MTHNKLEILLIPNFSFLTFWQKLLWLVCNCKRHLLQNYAKKNKKRNLYFFIVFILCLCDCLCYTYFLVEPEINHTPLSPLSKKTCAFFWKLGPVVGLAPQVYFLVFARQFRNKYPHYKSDCNAILQQKKLFVKRKMSRFAFFYVKLNEFGPLDHQIFFYDEAEDVLIVKIILLLENV